MQVLLVVPVHNRPNELEALLSSLRLLDLCDIQLNISVVDDGSPEPVDALFSNQFDDLALSFLRNEIPLGPGPARNLAARASKADFLWFLDSDTEIVNPDCLSHMLQMLNDDPSLAGAGGVLEPSGDTFVVQQLDILPNFLFLYRPVCHETFS